MDRRRFLQTAAAAGSALAAPAVVRQAAAASETPFDPAKERFHTFPSDRPSANVRQMDGRPGQAWGGEAGTNRLVVIETSSTA